MVTLDNAIPSKVVPLKLPSASELRSRLLCALPQRTHQGYLWADGMSLPNGMSISATHQKHAETGDIVPVPGSTNEWES